MGAKKFTVGVAIALSLSGCAAVFMEAAPDDYKPQQGPPYCSESVGWPMWDVLSAVTSGVLVAAILSSEHYRTDEDLGGVVIVGFSGVLHAASAASGFDWADDCANARRDYSEYMRLRLDGAGANEPTGPGRLGSACGPGGACAGGLRCDGEVCVPGSSSSPLTDSL